MCADPHPGNIAVDAENGGRLIYYDFGMMGAIPSDVRSGLLELFYGVYEKDPDRSVPTMCTSRHMTQSSAGVRDIIHSSLF